MACVATPTSHPNRTVVNELRWLQRLLGGPWPMPLFGNLWLVLREGGVNVMHQALHAASSRYGSATAFPLLLLLCSTVTREPPPPAPADFYLVWLGISPFLVVHDLQLVKEVLHTPSTSKHFKKGMFVEIMRPLLGQGLLLSEGW